MTKKILVEFLKEVRKKNDERCYTIKSREELYNEACAFAINKFEYGDHLYGYGAHGECIVGERDYKFQELLKFEKRKARDFLEYARRRERQGLLQIENIANIM